MDTRQDRQRDATPALNVTSPPPNNSADAHRKLAEQLFGDDTPPRRAHQDKGKGRAIPAPEDDEVSDHESRHDGGPDDVDDYDEYFQNQLEDEEWQDAAGFANLHGTTREVLEIDSDDDIEVQVATARRLGQGGGGLVNVGHEPGPPRDGSPDAADQRYISTLSPTKKAGCE